MKKIFLGIIFGLIICSALVPIFVTYAIQECSENVNTGTAITCAPGERKAECCPQKGESGLIVCGMPCCRCRFCDFFVLLDRIIDFAMFRLAPLAAVILIIVGGVMFLISSGDPSKVTRAKSIILSVIIGLSIMYGSYMVIGFILKQIGLATWTQEMFSSWMNEGVFEIDCGDGP